MGSWHSQPGKKAYVAQYRKDGRSHRITIGEHGRLTPDEARSEAKKVLGAVETGADPLEERRAGRAVRTFKEVANDFLAIHVEPKRKKRTKEEYERLLRLYIFPAIGSRRMTDIRRSDVARLHEKMGDVPFAANRALALISSVWNWAARRDEPRVSFGDNPAKGIEKNREQGRERFLSKDELARLGDAMREAETIGLPWKVEEDKLTKHAPKGAKRTKLDPFALAAVRLLLLTGARLREIIHAEWQHVDFERGLILLPDSKTGKKPIYLSAAALAVLEALPRMEENPHIIAGSKSGKPRADLKSHGQPSRERQAWRAFGSMIYVIRMQASERGRD
nr:integrase arm-type DNA-binding domain-containing protein [Microvirga vignae]